MTELRILTLRKGVILLATPSQQGQAEEAKCGTPAPGHPARVPSTTEVPGDPAPRACIKHSWCITTATRAPPPQGRLAVGPAGAGCTRWLGRAKVGPPWEGRGHRLWEAGGQMLPPGQHGAPGHRLCVLALRLSHHASVSKHGEEGGCQGLDDKGGWLQGQRRRPDHRDPV